MSLSLHLLCAVALATEPAATADAPAAADQDGAVVAAPLDAEGVPHDAPGVEDDARRDPSGDAPMTSAPNLPARVTRTDGRRVIVNMGTDDGLEVGDPVALYDVAQTQIGDEVIEELELRTIGKAVAVGDAGAVVAVGVNQDVPVGAQAKRLFREDTGAFLAPPRLGGRGFFRGEARGIVSMADAGGGVYLAGTLGYRFRVPLSIELRATPIFIGNDDQGGGRSNLVGKSSAVAIVSFDHHLVALGLGAGVAMNPDGARPVFAQRLRVGAEDGMAFTFTSQLTQYPSRDGRAQWAVDLNEAVVQLPMTAGKVPTWLVLRGMGGEFGGGGYVGTRVRVHGNGGVGTWGLTPYVGAERYVAGVWDYEDMSRWTDLVGPAFGLAVEAEF